MSSVVASSISSVNSVLPGTRARWGAVCAAGLLVLALGVAVSSSVGPVVDWGMDGTLSPGEWQPRYWLIGALLSALFLPTLGWPAAIAVAVTVAVGAAVAAASGRPGCPSCGRPVGDAVGRCCACGAVPPRRPSRAGGRVLARATLGGIAALFLLVPLVAFVASGVAWVQLEREEDAFGERARAAAASGSTSHEEFGRYGSLLWWRVQHGYGSHRD